MGILATKGWSHKARGQYRFGSTRPLGGSGRILESARTLQTSPEGGPVSNVLPFANLRRSLNVLCHKAEAVHKRI